MPPTPERLVVALGGNALLRQGDSGTAAEQAARSLAAMGAVASLLTPERQVVITHGNGPTVGNILIRQQLARLAVPPMPLDVCGAESQGNIGYLLERALVQILHQRRVQRSVATVLSLVEVDPEDPAFARPMKPIGPFLSAAEAEELGRSVPVARIGDRGFRRVVASPSPQRIIECTAIDVLLTAGVVPITLGGGGVPIIINHAHELIGVEAVIDKDLSSSLLAREIGARRLIILTDIDCVYLDFSSPQRQALRYLTTAEAEEHLRRGEFLPGSMRPKVEAGIAFLRSGGQQVLIGLPEDLPQLLAGNAGTVITP
ncbi:MAG: carbamate kinase [Deltaproteobacteria bacterium]|nr:carbamate kinase [Deltaproteobacteria bacterium]